MAGERPRGRGGVGETESERRERDMLGLTQRDPGTGDHGLPVGNYSVTISHLLAVAGRAAF